MSSRRWLVGLGALAFMVGAAACSATPISIPGAPDGGSASDAGAVDSSVLTDAGPAPGDLSMPDAGPSDAATDAVPSDAATDAVPSDAATDAVPSDAASSDAITDAIPDGGGDGAPGDATHDMQLGD